MPSLGLCLRGELDRLARDAARKPCSLSLERARVEPKVERQIAQLGHAHPAGIELIWAWLLQDEWKVPGNR